MAISGLPESTVLVLGSVLGGMLLLQAVLLWRLLGAVGVLRRFDDRLERLSDALSLLTETSESGFRAMGAELERVGQTVTARRPGRTANTRVAAAAKRGQSVPQIAVREEMSEGEVRLRLHLAEMSQGPGAAGAQTRGGRDGSLRA